MNSQANPGPEQFSQRVELAGWTLAWEGLLYLPGRRAGGESAEALLRLAMLGEVGPASCCARGSYWMVIAGPDGRRHYFTDPAALLPGFIAGDGIWFHYLDALRSEGHRLETLDPDGVVEFLNGGRFGANTTHHASVRGQRGDDWVIWHPSGRLELRQRGLPALGSDGGEGLETTFEDLATALSGRRVSVDLTAGLDSRLIVALLHHFGLEFETALSGQPGYSEFGPAEAVADALGLRFTRYGHPMEDFEDVLVDQVRASQGLIDVVSSYRASTMQATRAAEGFEVVVGGVGGEMINDYALLQDLPFPYRKRADLGRFFDLRLMSNRMPEQLLAGDYRQAQAGLRQRILTRLEGFRLDHAAGTCLNIFHKHRMASVASPQLRASWHRGLAHLAPLMDYHLFVGTYGLPMSDRLASRLHRRLIRERAPAICGWNPPRACRFMMGRPPSGGT